MTDKSGTYRDAILEAKRLREVAEANAKRALIEAVTPRIRDMIERELLGEDVDVSDEDILEEAASEAMGEESIQEDASAGEVPSSPSASDSASVITDGDSDDCEEDDLLLSREAVQALNAMTESAEVAKLEARASGALKKLSLVKEMMSSGAHKKASDRVVVLNMLRKIVSETNFLTETVIRKREKGRIPATLVSNVKRLSEEIRMGSKARKLKEEANKDMYEIDMSGLDADTEDAPDAGGLEDLDAGAPEDMDPEGSEGGEVAEIPMDLAQELLAALEADVGGAEADMPAEDVPAEDEDGDDEKGGEEEELDDDEIVEIDEGMLRRELARMKGARTLRESKTSAHDASVLDDFGGGEVEREMFVDSTDEDLNVLEVRRLKTALRNESRKNRALRTEVDNTKKVIHKLKEQIEAVNLFNAKLLYVNRMMANEGVTPRQRKAFIASLDKTESLREVKLLYKTVIDHVGKRQASPISESTSRKVASSSKVTQAGSLSEAADPTLNRWAVLAGIDQSE